MRIPVFRPTLKRREMDSVLTCMVSDNIGPGELSRTFIQQLAQYLNLSGGLAVSSYRAALSAALDALELESGDGVLISGLSPPVYKQLLLEKSLIPLFVDVDPESGCVFPDEVERKKKDNAKAILLHYPLGFIPDAPALADLGVPMIEDLSQALGTEREGRKCGGDGDISVVSLDPGSMITCGGGGAVLSAKRSVLRFLGQFGTGSEMLLPDLNVSLGIAQMREIDGFIARRREICDIYSKSLARSRHRAIVQKNKGVNVPYSFPVMLEDSMQIVMQYARKHNVETRPAFPESILADNDEQAGCPVSVNIGLRCLLFPLYPLLGKKNIETVVRVLATLP